MSELTGLVRAYTNAAETLLLEFDDQKDALFNGETITQFQFTYTLENQVWLEERLPSLAENLLPADFRMRISVVIYDYEVILLIRDETGRLRADVERAGEYTGNESLGAIPESAIPPLMTLQERLQETRNGIWLNELCVLLKAITQAGGILEIETALFLDKRAIQRKLLAVLKEGDRPQLLVYLFPKALSRSLGRISLETLEREYFLPERRAVWLVFSMQGCLESNYLSVCGQVGDDRLEGLLAEKLSEEDLQANLKAIDLRRKTGIWTDPPRWLAPGVFDMQPVSEGERAAARELRAKLQSLRRLLSVLFLADQVEAEEDCYRVSYRGLGSMTFWLGRADIQPAHGQADDIYSLYTYAFAGFSPDKVEIAQQFLSLMAEDMDGLVRKAGEAREATQKTYEERVLVERVSDYFDARHKVQERLRSATEAASEGLIELSREVSGDVYKMAGLLAAAVVAAVIQPDITLLAVLAASGILVIYLALVLFFHLPILQRSNKLRLHGYKTSIRSFGDVLSISEVQGYLEDDQLAQAQILLDQAVRKAVFIYRMFFLGSVIILIWTIWISLRSTGT